MTIGGLGSGLDFLYDENATEVQVKKTLRVSELEPNRDQPRKQFSDEAIQTLADSIQQYGMIQPILVRPLGLNYQIVAGERRWRAARMLGMDEVPVVIRELTDEETMAVALIENLQREDLNPLEEANAYAQLMDMFHLTQEEVAKRVGKSRSALLGISDEKLLPETAAKAADGKLTVRAVEKIAADSEKPEKRTKFSHKDSFYKEIEISLESRLGRRVTVTAGKNKGTLNLEFYDKDDLSALAQKLTKE